MIEAEVTVDELARRRVPPGLADHLERNFGQVSPSACQVAGVAALVGRHWAAAEVATLLGWPTAAVGSAGEELAGAWLVDRESDGYTFRHESFRQYAARFVAPADRRAYRRRWVDVRLAAGARPVEVVSVLAAVAEPGDEAAVTVLAAAARELGENTPSQAGDLYLRALDLDRADTPERAQLAAEAAVVLWAARRGADGSAVSETSLRGFADAPAEAQARYELALRLADYTSPETIRQCRLALSLPGIPSDLRARLLSLLIGALYTADVLEAVPGLQAPALAAADETDGDLGARLTTLDSGSIVSYYEGDVEGALAAADEADALRALHRWPGPTNAPYDLWPTLLLRSVGRAAEGLARAAQETRAAYASGRGLGMLRWGAARADLQLETGHLLEARAEAEGLREFAEVVDHDGFAGDLVMRVQARVAVQLGGPGEIAAARRQVVTRLESDRRWQRATALLDGALLADQAGDPAEVATLVRQALQNREPDGLRFLAGADATDELLVARLALRAGEPEIAAEVLRTLELLDRRNPRLPFLHGLALHLTGLTGHDPEPIARAALINDAAGDNVLPRALAHEDAGEGFLAGGDPTEGVASLRRALAIYERIRARNAAARVRARLAGAGVTGLPATTPLPDVEALAARLRAEGRTTQQIAAQLDLPPHTVRALLRRAAGAEPAGG